MKNKSTREKKYIINKRIPQFIIIISGMLTLGWFVLVVIANWPKALEDGWIWFLLRDMAIQILPIFATVMISALISATVIEVKEKNKLLDEIMREDVLLSDYIIDNLEFSRKKALLNKLYLDEKVSPHREMFEHMMKNLDDHRSNLKGDKTLYYEKCHITVNCEIGDEFITKTITRVIELKSELPMKFGRHKIIGLAYSPDSKEPELLNFSVDGQPRKDSVVHEYPTNEDNHLMNKSKNTIKKDFIYIDPDDRGIDNTNGVPFKIVYRTAVPNWDKNYTCRLKYPCKDFQLIFNIDPNDSRYCLHTAAFGFVDDGKASPNDDSGQHVTIVFENWAFPNDGVSVTMQEIVDRKREQEYNGIGTGGDSYEERGIYVT
ncbi:MAG: hypothetical protein LBM18_06415 [Oscillospiraceae bacterium]|nr:hypothetical protein [Oscillospiraceae bacterium]